METNSIVLNDLNEIKEANVQWETLRGKTILVTGANGFLATYIIKSILHNVEDVKVIGLVRNIDKAHQRFIDYRLNNSLKIYSQDLTSPITIDEDIHFAIHAASQASPKFYGTDPVGTIEANTIGTYNLLQFLRRQPLESYLYFSSGEVYGIVDESKIPMTEKDYGYVDPIEVRSCYAESKRMGENLCVSYYHQYQIPIKIVRPFHTYGPGMDLYDGRVFADFVRNVVQKENIILNSDGSARRPFCYISDATIGFLKILLEGKNGEVYNMGNPYQEYSILELAELIINIKPELSLEIEKNIPINDSNQYLKSPIKRNSPNIDKISRLNWHPKIDAHEGFRRTIDSFL